MKLQESVSLQVLLLGAKVVCAVGQVYAVLLPCFAFFFPFGDLYCLSLHLPSLSLFFCPYYVSCLFPNRKGLFLQKNQKLNKKSIIVICVHIFIRFEEKSWYRPLTADMSHLWIPSDNSRQKSGQNPWT